MFSSLLFSDPLYLFFLFFFFNDTATTEIYTLSLHDALPISRHTGPNARQRVRRPLTCVTWACSRRASGRHARGDRTRPASARTRGGPLSGTILYLAIVAIWAGVLVPRWLRRDPHRDSRARRASMAESLALSDVPGASDALADDILDAEVAREGSAVRPRGGAQGGRVPSSAARRPGSVVTARRRLLGMLLVLEVTAAAVAAVGAAAWWVVAPPTGMLAVFLTLLREAARADAELTQARTLRAQSSSPTS